MKTQFVVVVAGVISWASCVEAGTATIYGRVVESDGTTPASSVPVTLRVEGVIDADFPWISRTVMTDASGNYSTTMSFPEIVEITFHADVMTSTQLPFKRGSNFVGFYDTPPVDGGSYQLDVKLSPLPSGAVIEGFVRDRETGVPLTNFSVAVTVEGQVGSYSFEAQSGGNYRGLIDLGSPSASITVWAPAAGEELGYVQKRKSFTVTSGATQTVHFNLFRDRRKGYLYGRVIEASTSQPIPFASVYVSFPPDEFPVGLSVTDFLGRYKQYVDRTGSYKVMTTGAHTQVERRSDYSFQEKSVNVLGDQAVDVDFKMIKK